MIESKKISVEDLKKYWLGVGMLLYLVKQSTLDIANVTKKLSQSNDGANHAALKELLCVIKYVLDAKNFGSNLGPTGNANKLKEKVCFRDSNYAGDVVSRRSVSGFIL